MLTVVLATRNRAQILRAVLESYCELHTPPAGWKLIVVDNGSSDETLQVIASFHNRLPLYSLVEPASGKNKALNAGLEFIEGDLAVFTDDDVFPHSDWLIQLRNAADGHPEYSVFGGTVLPRWETAPPTWINWVQREPVFTLTDPSQTDGPIKPYLVFGPNMAIRTSIFQSGIRFDTSIGPNSANYAMGSETELLLRLGSQGHRAMFVSGARVEHLIRNDQLKKSWAFKRATRYGRGYFRLFQMEELRVRRLVMGIPRYFFRPIFEEGFRSLWAFARGKEEEYFRSRWKFNFLRGNATEAHAISILQKDKSVTRLL